MGPPGPGEQFSVYWGSGGPAGSGGGHRPAANKKAPACGPQPCPPIQSPVRRARQGPSLVFCRGSVWGGGSRNAGMRSPKSRAETAAALEPAGAAPHAGPPPPGDGLTSAGLTSTGSHCGPETAAGPCVQGDPGRPGHRPISVAWSPQGGGWGRGPRPPPRPVLGLSPAPRCLWAAPRCSSPGPWTAGG